MSGAQAAAAETVDTEDPEIAEVTGNAEFGDGRGDADGDGNGEGEGEA